MENEWLYRRPVDSDTETPIEAHLQAMFAAYQGKRIEPHVYRAVMGYAVVRKDSLREALDFVNETAGFPSDEELINKNLQKLGVAIISSYGIESLNAATRRGQNLAYYFNGMILAEDLGTE
jgi:hypothetical protein